MQQDNFITRFRGQLEHSRNSLNHYLAHVFKGSHVVYFSAAAVGAHEVYAWAATVILGVMALEFMLHLDLGA